MGLMRQDRSWPTVLLASNAKNLDSGEPFSRRTLENSIQICLVGHLLGNDNADVGSQYALRRTLSVRFPNSFWLAPEFGGVSLGMIGGDKVDYCCTCQRDGNP